MITAPLQPCPDVGSLTDRLGHRIKKIPIIRMARLYSGDFVVAPGKMYIRIGVEAKHIGCSPHQACGHRYDS
jgi:hypothetical protein